MSRIARLALLGVSLSALLLAASCGDDDNQNPVCGNGVCDTGETAESCPADCEGCGDGVKDQGEECDGEDFGAATCESEGAGGGTLYCNANCTINDNYCCEHTCDTEGDTRCQGSMVQSCEVTQDGCRAWVDQNDCADTSEVCLVRGNVATCEDACTDECGAVGDTQCNGAVIQTCGEDPIDGCLYWNDGVDCSDTGELCEDATGSAVCTDTCIDECTTLDASQCGTAAVETCQAQADGCNDWVVTQDCGANGEICNDNTGAPACCANECATLGQTRCTAGNDAVETCGVGPEGCTEWQVTDSCSAGETCTGSGGTFVCEMPSGEDCTSPIPLAAGTNSVSWTATTNDYLSTTPDCVTVGSVDGADVVLSYTATFNGYLDVNVINKPTDTRWVMVVSSGACGQLTPEMACISEWAPTEMGDTFPVSAGTTYYFYVADTSSGTGPLDNPFTVVVSEINCSGQAVNTLSTVPTNNATAVAVMDPLEVTFSGPVDTSAGIVTLTGTGGTNVSYDLSASPSEISFNTAGDTMTITPSTLFLAGETITVSWSGLQDSLCGNAVAPPTWSFQVESQIDPGEVCTDPLILAPGTATYPWAAVSQDYFTSVPCGTSTLSGPDVVGIYTATVTGNVTITMDKPTSNRMFLAGYGASCGDVSSPLACTSDYSASQASIQFPVVSGQSYPIYFGDTTSGSQALPDPLSLDIVEFDCSGVPAGVATVGSPVNGATGVYPNESLEVTFDKAVLTTQGVISITGTGGTNLSYDLSTSPAEVVFSNNDQTLTITPATPFGLNETETVTWTGLRDQECGKSITPPAWSFQTAATLPPGEDCSDPIVLQDGSQTYYWYGSAADYYGSTVPCGITSYSPTGPDLVARYTASVTGYVDVTWNKPSSQRMFFAAYDSNCGDLGSMLACDNDFTPSSLSLQFNVTAGQDYYLYFMDTTSGTDPLPNPLDLTITATDCGPLPAATVTDQSPADGSASVLPNAPVVITFDKPMRDDKGVITLTGDMGTSLSYDISAAPAEVAFSNNDQTITITPAVDYNLGETITVSWSGLMDAECEKVVSAPSWSFTVVPVLLPGESCSDPLALSTGDATYLYWAVNQDYFTSVPCGTSYTLTGGDVVGHYQATVNGYLSITMQKPVNNRMWMAVYDSACGDTSSQVACTNEYSYTELNSTFAVTAGTDYWVYWSDTSSGSETLPNPLDLNVTEIDCSTYEDAVVSVAPAHQTTTDTLRPTFTVDFATELDTTQGVFTLTGDQGTNLSYDLSTSPAEVSFSNGDRTVTLDPGMSLPPGENLTISWTGLADNLCGNPAETPPWDVTIIVPPCSPGAGGVVGTTQTPVNSGLTYSSEYYVMTDDNPSGWVYVGSTSYLYRVPKAGGASEDVKTLAGLTTSQLGYAAVANGPDLFTVESKTTGTTGFLYRISADGGQTWSSPPEDWATFPTTPGDDFRAAAVYGGRIYLLTHEYTGSTPTEIWSVDAANPGTATLEGTFSDSYYCNGLAVDSQYFYVACGGTDELLRLARADAPNFTGTVVSDTMDFYSYSTSTVVARDLDSDGVADVLYGHGDGPEVWYVCDPAGAVPYTDLLATVGSVNNGMDFEPSANALWLYDDSSYEFVKLQ